MQIFRLKSKKGKAEKRKASFLKNEQGVTVIEFGLLAFPFFGLLAVILETALIFIAGIVLDSAVDDGVRLIRTGQAQEANFNANNFRDAICAGTVQMFDCNELKIRVRVVNNFRQSNSVTQFINPVDGSWRNVTSYDDGSGTSIILAEVYYKWKPVVTLRWFNIGALADGTRLLGAARVWRNEPF